MRHSDPNRTKQNQKKKIGGSQEVRTSLVLICGQALHGKCSQNYTSFPETVNLCVPLFLPTGSYLNFIRVEKLLCILSLYRIGNFSKIILIRIYQGSPHLRITGRHDFSLRRQEGEVRG